MTNTVSGNTSGQGRVCSPRCSRHHCRCCSARSSRSRPRRRWLSTATQEADACSSPLLPAPAGLAPDAPNAPCPDAPNAPMPLMPHGWLWPRMEPGSPAERSLGTQLIASCVGIGRGARKTGARRGRAVGQCGERSFP